jgi:hypothetical protein
MYGNFLGHDPRSRSQREPSKPCLLMLKFGLYWRLYWFGVREKQCLLAEHGLPSRTNNMCLLLSQHAALLIAGSHMSGFRRDALLCFSIWAVKFSEDMCTKNTAALNWKKQWREREGVLYVCYPFTVSECARRHAAIGSENVRPCLPQIPLWALFSQIHPQILLCKKKISHHIKMPAYIWSTKCRWNQKLIAQFCCTLRDEYLKPN